MFAKLVFGRPENKLEQVRNVIHLYSSYFHICTTGSDIRVNNNLIFVATHNEFGEKKANFEDKKARKEHF